MSVSPGGRPIDNRRHEQARRKKRVQRAGVMPSSSDFGHRQRRRYNMARRVRSCMFEVQQRRTTVARLYLQQRTQEEIARQVGVDQGTICRDLKAIQAEWQRQRLDDFHQAKLRELARIDRLERQYWDAWERSCNEREQTVQEKNSSPSGDRFKAATRTEARDGNAEFLRGVERCIEMRCK